MGLLINSYIVILTFDGGLRVVHLCIAPVILLVKSFDVTVLGDMGRYSGGG